MTGRTRRGHDKQGQVKDATVLPCGRRGSVRAASRAIAPQPASISPDGERAFDLRGIPIQPKLTVNEPNDRYEREADRVADRVMRMTGPAIQRKPG